MKIIKLLLQYEQQFLSVILLLLHSLIWIIDDALIQFALTSVLYGLFLLWQPLWGKETPANNFLYILPIILLLVFSYYYQNESLIFFSLIITGLIGSRLFSYNTSRAFDLLAILVLILEISIGIIPLTFDQITLSPQFNFYIQNIVLILILIFLFAPTPERSPQTRSQIDLMHGVLTATLISIVLLGGIVINTLYGVDYIEGLLLTVFFVATLALGISWFWNPGVGYSGLGVLWNRYAMTIGGPFETWINTLTTLIEEPYISANEFLQAACDHLIDNDWLNGIQWQFDTFNIQSGKKTGIVYQHNLSKHLIVNIFFKSDPGPALRQHTILLVRMAYQFYLSKINQEKIEAEAHFKTIHHTGARLTHDIKNILQSIKASLDIIKHSTSANDQLPTNLLRQNLHQIDHRLETTLNKLKAPELSTTIKYTTIGSWLDHFARSNQFSKTNIKTDISVDHDVPPELFDSVINNLISNADEKEEVNTIILNILSDIDMIALTVCDDGKEITPEVERQLFNKPVSSGQGMGIGLYQSAIMARSFNYELELANNQNGNVCFSLIQHLND